MVDVREATEVTDELLRTLARLIPQLSTTSPALTESDLRRIVDSQSTTLLLAQIGSQIVGTLSLILFRSPTGTRALIEDVVVDKNARRLGVGEALTRAAVEAAEKEGARTIDLTSRPHRIAANNLYQKFGFKLRQTNVYRLDCNPTGRNEIQSVKPQI